MREPSGALRHSVVVDELSYNFRRQRQLERFGLETQPEPGGPIPAAHSAALRVFSDVLESRSSAHGSREKLRLRVTTRLSYYKKTYTGRTRGRGGVTSQIMLMKPSFASPNSSSVPQLK